MMKVHVLRVIEVLPTSHAPDWDVIGEICGTRIDDVT
jgi:hypothetical protein